MTVMVIGLGSMGKRRIRLIRALKLPVDIVGIDNRADRRDDVKTDFGIMCYASLEAAEKREKIDCAFICTSPLAHGDLIKTCLEHKYHVFTEINLVADQYEGNIALAREKGLALFLSSTPIYRDEMKKITEEVRASKYPVAYLYHVGQYLSDWHPWEAYKDFFVGDNRTNGCREIFAIELPWMEKAFGKIQSVSVHSQKLTDLDVDYKDTYLVHISHDNGNKGVFAVDVVCRRPVRRLEVYNEQLYLEWNGTPQTLKKQNIVTSDLEKVECGSYYNEPGYSEFVNECAYMNEIKEFFAVIKGKKPEYTMEMDAHILKIIDKIEEMGNMGGRE